jgi:acetolactate synthase regulatory subunit
MEKISLQDASGKVLEYPSLNQATRENGALSGMNRENAIKFLEKRGFKVLSIEKSQSDNGIIERVIKMVSRVDKAKVEELEKQLANAIDSLKTQSDIAKMLEIKNALKIAKTPTATLENVIAKITELYNEHNQNQNE